MKKLEKVKFVKESFGPVIVIDLEYYPPLSDLRTWSVYCFSKKTQISAVYWKMIKKFYNIDIAVNKHLVCLNLLVLFDGLASFKNDLRIRIVR